MRLVALGCERNGYPALLRYFHRVSLPLGWELKELSAIPCLGVIREEAIFSILEKRADVLLLAGCPLDACKNIKGSSVGLRKVTRINTLLEEAQVNKKVALALVTPDKTGEIERTLTEIFDFFGGSNKQ
ncbi:MAG: hydrogenase iron-sulfur subunit [Candidatus Atribacteria bacterium]|nr:hydrogenase iron-sulfur subunit [Candidatus Atribacteria bacterium]MCD6349992.1 hydrogenase iron-sulfur subunit [Candidatus Atribacteria bacterium]